MKFGKKIAEAAALSTALVESRCWLDYKLLKKVLKTFDHVLPQADGTSASSPGGPGPHTLSTKRSSPNATTISRSNLPMSQTGARGTDENAQNQGMENSTNERRFFIALKRELQKVTSVYLKLEQRELSEFVEFIVPLRERNRSSTVNPNGVAVSPDDLGKLLVLHERLLLLRNFAVLNYIGFTKILKKHDKLTGFETRDKYMLKIVDEQPFTRHSLLQATLCHVDIGKLPSQMGAISRVLFVHAVVSVLTMSDLFLFLLCFDLIKKKIELQSIKASGCLSKDDEQVF